MAFCTNIRKVISGLFLILFVTYYANAALFEHCHMVGGVTIVHSHFHHESHHATSSGGHSASSITLIAALNHIQYTDAGFSAFDMTAHPALYALCIEKPQSKAPSATILHHSLRAPPALQSAI